MKNNIKAIAFDFDGVLGKFNVASLVSQFSGKEKILLLRAIVHKIGLLPSSKYFKELFDEYQKGTLYQSEYIALLSKHYNFSPDTMQLLLDSIPASLELNTNMIDFMIHLKNDKGYKVSVITNNLPECKPIINKYIAPIANDIVYSSDEGIIKPDPSIYKLAAKRLGVKPEEMIFIDDKQKNIKAANELGIKGIHCKNTIHTLSEVETILHGDLEFEKE